MKKKYFEVLTNYFYNFFSSALPTVALQFIVQPMIAKTLGGEQNGQYLTLMSLNFFIIGVTSAVLNTVRMLQNDNYEKKNIKGDFNLIWLFYALLILIAMPLGYTIYTKEWDLIGASLYVIIGMLYLYHDYIYAEYRLKMQFNKILYSNCMLVIGYIIGLVIFMKVSSRWQIVIITAYLMGAIYDYNNTSFIKEPVKKTPLFKQTFNKVCFLTTANALDMSVTYFDKLALYPLLGGTAVSVYNTATLVGKMLLLVSAPLNSLLLSYLVKMDSLKVSLSKKKVAVVLGTAAAAYLTCVLIGYPLTELLYPQWAKQSQLFIPITVASSLLSLISGLLNTVVIRFFNTGYQVYVQGGSLILYLTLCLLLLHTGGLMGFSIGVLLTSLIKCAALLVLVLKKL